VGAFLTAIVFQKVFVNKGISFEGALLFGSIVSATDPVAVVAMLKDLGASKKINTLIEGESLLNDGTAMVLFSVVLVSIKEIFIIESIVIL
jgi:NhaP-type Na+/H+ or K+/H+ antiporter